MCTNDTVQPLLGRPCLSVPHRALLKKHQDMGVYSYLLHTELATPLIVIEQRVVLNWISSALAHVLSGIPQGSVIGPPLFLIMMLRIFILMAYQVHD